MERRAHILAAMFVSTSAFASCGRARVAINNLFRDPPDQVRFSHQDHLSRGAGCPSCHAAIDDPKATLPGHESCAGTCHDVQDQSTCTVCHTDTARARSSRSADRGLIFRHATHREATHNNCMRCHQAVATASSKVEMPSMESCGESCHREDLRELKCDRCHVELARYPLQSIRSWAHTGNFERRHGAAAKHAPATCTTCHEQTFCSDCHADATPVGLELRRADQTTRAFIHPAPYEALHAIDAAARKDSCDTCHRPSFCTSCHAQRGLAGLEQTIVSQHPAGWLDPMSTKFHGLEARRSIASCAGCHDQGERSVCVRCHQVGGTGGNPHPHKFRRRDPPEDNRMCRVCHLNGTAL